jgi:hypothetical protein
VHFSPDWKGSGAGFGAHPIFTGIQHLHEGYVLCQIETSGPALKIIANNREGKPLVGVIDPIPSKWNDIEADTGAGRIVIDCASDRLTAGLSQHDKAAGRVGARHCWLTCIILCAFTLCGQATSTKLALCASSSMPQRG